MRGQHRFERGVVMSGNRLHGVLVRTGLLGESVRTGMFGLMQQFYDNTDYTVFLRDLQEKDFCILLCDGGGNLRGFSTQMTISIQTGEQTVHGIFSGDTIIHSDYWGSLELFRVFIQNMVPLGTQYSSFYWFLTSKGYKTYRMLPVFFKEFYPSCRSATPRCEQTVMHAFGRVRYPGRYDETSGVVTYRETKDKLKTGIADVTENRLRDEHVRFFVEKNPGYLEGNDLVCIASLAETNFRDGVRNLLFRKG
jgi:hypothetical protein